MTRRHGGFPRGGAVTHDRSAHPVPRGVRAPTAGTETVPDLVRVLLAEKWRGTMPSPPVGGRFRNREEIGGVRSTCSCGPADPEQIRNTADFRPRNAWSERCEGGSRPVSRILSAPKGRTAIHLGPPLPTASVRSTRGLGRAALRHPRGDRGPLFDLAPGGVYRADRITPDAGGLLHHRFTLTTASGGGLLSVALSRGSPRVGVTDHPALWSPDFPRTRVAGPRPSGRLPLTHPFYAGPAAMPSRWAVSLSERTTMGPSA